MTASQTFNLHNVLSKSKAHHTAIGLTGTIIGIVSFIPILYIVWKTKKTHNFTYINLLLAMTSNLIWIYFGFVTDTDATKFMGVLYFLIYSYILTFKVKY